MNTAMSRSAPRPHSEPDCGDSGGYDLHHIALVSGGDVGASTLDNKADVGLDVPGRHLVGLDDLADVGNPLHHGLCYCWW